MRVKVTVDIEIIETGQDDYFELLIEPIILLSQAPEYYRVTQEVFVLRIQDWQILSKESGFLIEKAEKGES